MTDLKYAARTLLKSPMFTAVAVISLAACRAVASLLFGLQANDPLTFLAAGTALAIVAFGASYLPAHRASTVDAAIALRGE